jgi:hypothetical protein
MVVAISAHDVPALLGLNPYVPQKLAMAKVLLQQRAPILEAMRGDSLVKRALGDIYPTPTTWTPPYEAAAAGPAFCSATVL